MKRENIIDIVEASSKKVAEIGVEYGGFTSSYYNDDIDIHLIDMWETEGNDYYFSERKGQVERGYQKILQLYGDKNNVTIVKSKSDKASELYDDEYFDYIYIDADHSYEGVKKDIQLWYPKVKKGGIMAGHDFDPNPLDKNFEKYGVKKAVKEFFDNKFELTTEEYYKSWYIKK
tara:strand:+ start:845 stop:1366 length:522 start_codon:yes stop_codon:yes gene_type:complete